MKTRISAGLLFALATCAIGTGLSAQTVSDAEAADDDEPYLNALKQCQSITADDERLVCYDSAVGRVVAATDQGDLTLVDREDVKETKRSLFGLGIPDLGIFGGDSDEEDKLFESTITKVSFRERKAISFTIADGNAVWRVANPPTRMRRLKAGDTVVFKKAALGSYFIRVNGATGVKGRRVR